MVLPSTIDEETLLNATVILVLLQAPSELEMVTLDFGDAEIPLRMALTR